MIEMVHPEDNVEIGKQDHMNEKAGASMKRESVEADRVFPN